ncbi:MAG: ABC transporter permease, partial [Vicinamibacteria bacterium]
MGVGRTPLRVALTALGVAIATGALISMVAFAQGVQSQAEKPFRKLELLNTIDVTSEDDAEGAAAVKGTAEASLLDDDALARMAAIPGVALAYPRLTLAGIQATCGGKTRTTFAMALPREASRLEFVKELVVAGRFFGPGGTEEVLIGKKLSRGLGFATPE